MCKKSIKIKTIKEDDVENAMNLLRRTFYVNEPMIKSLNLWDEHNPSEELEWYCRSTLKEKKSLQAIDKAGNMVSILVIGEIPLSMEEDEDAANMIAQCKDEKALKIVEIMKRREEGSKLGERYPKDKTLREIKIAATEPLWQGKGLMNKLMTEAIRKAKKEKVHLLRIDTSSQYSMKSAERFGFTCVYKALYADITQDGVPVVTPEPPHVDDRVYIKELYKL